MIEMEPGAGSPPEGSNCESSWPTSRPWEAMFGAGDGSFGGQASGRDPQTRTQISTLLRTVETQIIPRLMMLHRGPSQGHGAPARVPGTAAFISAQQVEEFTALVLHDPDAASSFVDGVLLSGTPLEAVYLDLLAPAARRLGEMWSDDQCDFTAVTLGLGRLHRVLRELSAEVRGPRDEGLPSHRVLLLPVPGEQHTFGLSMVMEFFRQAGWLVWHDPPESAKRLVSLVRDHWFDVVGLSVGSERHVDSLAGLIRDLRHHSHNRAALVLVGGPLVASRPELGGLVGADATASDARHAMLQVERLMASR